MRTEDEDFVGFVLGVVMVLLLMLGIIFIILLFNG